MKVLFISDFILAAEQGAKQSSKAHLNTLRNIFGKNSVDVVSINSLQKPNDECFVYIEGQHGKFHKFLNIISRSCFFLSKIGEDRIVQICKKNEYKLVFVDHSIYGHLIMRIKKECNVRVISYFHGIMAYQTEQYKRNNHVSILYSIPQKNTLFNEKLTVQYADKLLILNKRDEENLIYFYGRQADVYLPVYYNDTSHIHVSEPSDQINLLFVGGYFWPNIHGITWFVENVMTRVDKNVHLTIVGNKMEKLRDKLTRENVRVVGSVDSLDEYYNNADAVVGPIFEGEGMKTKTCEALMYGKKYIGTEEALEGYEELQDSACNSIDEFLSRIELLSYNRKRYYPENRELYLKKYSPQMAEEKLRSLFVSMDILN